MGRKFAVFDVDGTITRTSLLQLIARELVARGNLAVGTWHDIETYLHDFRQKVSDNDYPSYMIKAVELLFEHLKDLRVEEYMTVVEAVTKRSTSHTYVYTRELIKNLKSHGIFLIAISSSEMRAVDILTKSLGFDVAVGGVYFKGEETLTGEVETLNKPKGEILKALIQKYQLDTLGSLAVGGTSNDLAMLEMVQQPIAFNPNRALFSEARQKGWMIVVERKDVVYGLQPENNTYVLKQTNA